MTRHYVVEVTDYHGDDASIDVCDHRPDGTVESGHTVYCIAIQRPDGVLAFIDWGYRSAEDAFGTWPNAERR